ncbi:MAG: radical SAM protein, partial [Thermodesulfobacteriota bacterium]
SARCNLTCAFCPVTEGMDRETGNMDLALFKKVIDEADEYLLQIILWDWGEPFLNPELFAMISYATERNIWTVTSTNGHTLAKPGVADKIIDSGLDTLIIAVDGITQETYSKFRKGGDLSKVLNGIRKLVKRKRARGSSTPEINFRFIVMAHNEHELPKVKEFASSLGIDILTTRSMLNIYDEGGAKENEFAPQNNRFKRFDEDPEGKRVKLKQNPCKGLWNNPVVHWNGIVSPCCYDFDENYILGDVSKDSFKDIWYGAPYKSFRRRFRSNLNKAKMCNECTNAFEGGAIGTGSIKDIFFFNQEGLIETDKDK